MKRVFVWILLAMFPVIVLGQSPGAISGPTLGYMFDSDAGAIRPLMGIAGSSTIGAPIDLGFKLSMAVPLPDQRHVLVAPPAGSFLASIDMAMSPALSHPIKGAAISVDAISVSPHGTAAALLYLSSQLVQVVTGLPNNPSITLSVTTTVIGLPLRRVVVNDDASALVFSFAENDRETLYRWNRTDGFRLLASTSQVGALAFVGNTGVVFADSGTNEVFLSPDVLRQSTVKFLAGPRDGVSRPVGAGASSNEILVANAGSGTVILFDTNGRLLGTEPCNCSLTGLYPIGAGVFRLTDRFNQTMYILDGGGAENRIVFVPPLQ